METGNKRLGFVGLGAMGGAMAANMLKAGYAISGFDIAEPALAAFQKVGGVVSASPADAARDVGLLAVMVHNEAQVERVLFGDESRHAEGAVDTLAPNAIVWVASTVSPSFASALEARLAQRSFKLIDGPVSGGMTGAQDGTLTIIASGHPDAIAIAEPIMQACASKVHKVGGNAGAGSQVKLINQLLTATHIALTAEAVAFGVRAGLDPNVLTEVISQSAGRSFQFEKRAPRMVAGDHAKQSTVNIFLKDLEIALAAARELRFPTPITVTAHQVFTMAAGLGLATESDTRVLDVYERNGGVNVEEAGRKGGRAQGGEHE